MERWYKMLFCKKRRKLEDLNQKEVNIKENNIPLIIPLYLNQRIVYDTLAILNNGFTELYNVSNSNLNEVQKENNVSGELNVKGNPLTLMSAKIDSNISSKRGTVEKNHEDFTKVHTPASLFFQVYKYLNESGSLLNIESKNDFKIIKSGDFIEFKSNLVINTIEEGFRNALKMSNIGELFSSFGATPVDIKNKKIFSGVKKNLSELTKYLDFENEKIKYMLGSVDGEKLIVKIDRENIINADYDQISHGDFKIVGKVLEIIPEGKIINLNRESVLGLIKSETLLPIKTAIESMKNTMFAYEDIVDEIKGPVIIIVPIVIGI